MRFIICTLLLFITVNLHAQETAPADNAPQRTLPVIKTGSVEETVRTFMDAMNDYHKGVVTDDDWLKGRLDDAVFCLNLDEIPKVSRRFQGENAAIYLKEIIDRVILVEKMNFPTAPSNRWQLAGTIISIIQMDSGEREGEFLFSSNTVRMAPKIYKKISHLPYLDGSGSGAAINFEQDKKVKKATEGGGLNPIKTDNPRDTMRTFMTAMNDYREGVLTGDDGKKARINDAVACLNLQDMAILIQREKGKEAAILLKETIDRVIVIDYTKIPELTDVGEPIQNWRLKDTDIRIAPVSEGERAGEYLFTPRTVAQARIFYNMVKDKPYLKESGHGAMYTEPWLESSVPEWSRKEILFFPNWQWIGLFAAILLGYVIKTITEYLTAFIEKLTSKSNTKWDDIIIAAIQKPMGLIGASAFWALAVHILRFEGTAQSILLIVVQVIFSIAVIWLFYKLADVLTIYFEHFANKTDNALDDQLVPLIKKALRVFIVCFGFLVTFQNLGFNVMSVLAGLGIGGLAFALAAKDACANLIASILIICDRPFQVGDWVIIGDIDGSVESIGFRTTKVRTFYNSLISVPNATVANSNIDNMGRREYRRIKHTLGVTYDTPPEKLEAFMEGIKNIIKANEYTRKDYFHVCFTGYGPSSLDIMVYCFLKVPDWSMELIEKQNVFLEILRLADELGIEFAFPTQTLHMETFPEKKPTREQQPYEREAIAKQAASFGPKGENAKPAGSGLFTPPFKDPDLKSE